MATKRTWIVAAAALTLCGGFCSKALASEEGRRNTTIGLALATAYSYKRYDDSIKARHARERAAECEPRWHAHHDNGRHLGWYKHHHHHHDRD